jgi:hypothetical protein
MKSGKGHSRVLEDVTHVIGGIGLGMLLYPALRHRSKALAYILVLLSTALHFYADTVKPSGKTMGGGLRSPRT